MGRWRDPAHRAQYGGDYQRKRGVLLGGSPPCQVCGLRPATTLDHVVPIVLGGTNDWSNLRPACGLCNSRLGGRIGGRRKARRKHGLPAAARSSLG